MVMLMVQGFVYDSCILALNGVVDGVDRGEL